jgi:tetratricopeptide (TPR) repeat protein
VTASCDHTACVWDAATGELICPPLQHRDCVQCAFFDSDGRRVVTASLDGTASVWDAESGARLLGPLWQPPQLHYAAFSPDGSRIVTTGQDQTIRLWNARTGEPAAPPMFVGGRVWRAAFSSDGRLVVGSGLGHVSVWEVASGEQWTPPLTAHEKPDPLLSSACYDARFSPDGRFIATACANHTARLWDAQTGQPVTVPLALPAEVFHVEFSPDSQQFLTSTLDGRAQLWRLTACDYSAEDVTRFAQLLAGSRRDRMGTKHPLEPEELARLFTALRTKYPNRFAGPADETALWHEEMADAAERHNLAWGVVWHLERWLQFKPTRAGFQQRLGDAQAETGQWAKAAVAFAEAGKEHAASLALLHRKACVDLMRGDTNGFQRAATELFQRASAAQELTDIWRAGRTAILAPAGAREPAQLESLLRQRTVQHPKDGGTAISLSWVLHCNGKEDEALAELARIASWETMSGHVHFIQAHVNQKLGNKEEALRSLEAGDKWVNEQQARIAWKDRLELQALRRQVEALMPHNS